MNRVVITGIGIVSPVGSGSEQFWTNLTEGKSGIGPITLFDASSFPVRIGGEVKDFSIKNVIKIFPGAENIRDRKVFLALAAASEALENAFKEGESKKIKSTYFTISVFKKGTIHLVFNDENIRRRFNIIACKHKNWLPQDYGSKKFSSMSAEEQAVAESFEGKESYKRNINQIGFAKKNVKFLS